ncbi:MAG: hypothetical protein WCH75_17805 [Candidatus Binatia bacterium]
MEREKTSWRFSLSSGSIDSINGKLMARNPLIGGLAQGTKLLGQKGWMLTNQNPIRVLVTEKQGNPDGMRFLFAFY